jgi:hypothetical protein
MCVYVCDIRIAFSTQLLAHNHNKKFNDFVTRAPKVMTVYVAKKVLPLNYVCVLMVDTKEL